MYVDRLAATHGQANGGQPVQAPPVMPKVAPTVVAPAQQQVRQHHVVQRQRTYVQAPQQEDIGWVDQSLYATDFDYQSYVCARMVKATQATSYEAYQIEIGTFVPPAAHPVVPAPIPTPIAPGGNRQAVRVGSNASWSASRASTSLGLSTKSPSLSPGLREGPTPTSQEAITPWDSVPFGPDLTGYSPEIRAEFAEAARNPLAHMPQFDRLIQDSLDDTAPEPALPPDEAPGPSVPVAQPFANAVPASEPYLQNPYHFIGTGDAGYANAAMTQFTRQANRQIQQHNRVFEQSGMSDVVLRYDLRQGPGAYPPTLGQNGLSQERYKSTAREFEAIRQQIKGNFNWKQLGIDVGASLASCGIAAPYCIGKAIQRRGNKKVTEHAVPYIRSYMQQENQRLHDDGIPLSWKLETLIGIPVQCEVTLTKTMLS